MRIHRLVEGERQRLVEENTQLREELRERYEFTNIIGNSGPMRQVYEQVAQVRRHQRHGADPRRERHGQGAGRPRAAPPLAAGGQAVRRVNCAALPETLVETELFGHERGAFTGAQARRKGRFELADGGTLFLDEIGELSPSTQAKLLRVLQEREFERLGGNETIRVDVRLIAATNNDLEQALAEGTFREDLYYRLNVFTIYVPPLRERKSDILLLADHFVEKYARMHGRSIKRISTPAIDMLMSLPLAGQRARAREHASSAPCWWPTGSDPRPPPPADAADRGGVGHRGLALAGRGRGGVREQPDPGRAQEHARQPAPAARLLDTTERILSYKVRRYGIDPRRFRG